MIMCKNFKFAEDSIQINPKYDVEHVIKGEYDDYGLIESKTMTQKELHKFLDPHGENRLCFYLTQEAWDFCQKAFAQLSEHQQGWVTMEEYKEWHIELYRVINVFRMIWRNPLAGYNCFFQYTGDDELDMMDRVYREVTMPRIAKMRQDLKDELAE